MSFGSFRASAFLPCALLAVAGSAFGGDWAHAPKSTDYPIRGKFAQTPAPVVLARAKDRRYRTMLRRQARKGPNFAEHYTMAVIGCGMDSFFIAVVDARTGRIYWPPFGCITLTGGFEIPLPDGVGDQPNPAFRLDSRLFLIVGIETKEDAKPEDRAVQFWVFDGERFTLVYSIPAPIEDDEPNHGAGF